MEADATLPERLQRRLLELFHPAPPLERDTWLDAALAPVAESDRVAVRLPLLELPALAKPREDPLVCLRLREARELARGVVHAAVGPDHGQLRQAVVAADLVVLRIVAGRDL